MNDTTRTTYRVIQKGYGANVPVTDFESLVTHHPHGNRNAVMVDGAIVGGEVGRRHAYIGGEIQEIEVASSGRTFGLRPDQVLLKKDFILEHPNHPTMSAEARTVDVPSPIGGYVGRVDASQGLVDIYDTNGGDVVARVRHMRGIAVTEGQTIEYGQSLGTQSDVRTGAKHVHLEIDTRYYQQYENYISDLVSGRLPVEAEQRVGVRPLPIVDDGIFRLGESSERIGDLQRVMTSEGYRSANGGPLDQDGVYRPGMQGALLDFQRAHGLPQTGDIDPATLGMAPPAPNREADRHDHTAPGLAPNAPAPERRAPGHPDHPDHRQHLPNPLPPPVNQPAPGRRGPADRDHPDHAMLEQIREGIRRIDAGIGKPYDETSERLGRCLLPECKDRGLQRVDHVVMGRDGTNLFAIQGQLTDPILQRAHVSTEQAIRTPVEQSDERLLAINQSIVQQQQPAQQQELARGQDDPDRAGLAMR